MLERVYIDNYRCLVNFELVLPDFAVLIGGNGSGKSVFLDALWSVFRLVLLEAKCNEVFTSETRTRWSSQPSQRFELHFREGDVQIEYRLVIDQSGAQPRLQSEQLLVDDVLVAEYDVSGRLLTRSRQAVIGEGLFSDESFIARLEDEPVKRFKGQLGTLWIMRLQPGHMAATSRQESAWLDRDGSNFASWYRQLTQTQTEDVSAYFSMLKPIVPGFKTLKLSAEGAERRLVVEFDLKGARYAVGFDELSDGQRALIVLYALIAFDFGRPITLILDEPDNFVELAEIQPLLMELSDRLADIGRVIIVSHHPEVIDRLAAHDVIRFARPDGAAVRAGRLTDAPEPGVKLSDFVMRRLLDEQ